MILSKFSKPTNIIIIGSHMDGYGKEFGLTDDYSGFDLKIGNKEFGIESDGFFTILTEEELYRFIVDKNFLNKDIDDYTEIYDEADVFLIKNFIGNIEGKLLDTNGSELDFSNCDYIYHMVENDGEFSVLLPENTEYENLEYSGFLNYCNIVNTIYSREEKINKILK